MLIGTLLFSRCHSSNHLMRAPSRIAFQSTSTICTTSSLGQFQSRTLTHACDSSRIWRYGYVFNWHDKQPRLQNVFLSTFTPISIKSRNHEAKFLKPRRKPKFRERTVDEHNELLEELSKAQAQYNAHRVQQQNNDQGRNHEQELRNTANDVEATFTSPFFATPSLYQANAKETTASQATTMQSSKLPTNFPKRSSLSRNRASTSSLEQELYYLSHHDPNPIAIHSILKILVQDRKTKPTSQYYEAWILANTWPEYGSVSNVEDILTEMESEGLDIGANIVAAVLKVIAIHPSPKLSYRMLNLAERRWIQLPSQTQHHMILAMIRTGQTELAAWTLDVLRQASKPLRSRDREIIPDYLIVLLLTEMVRIHDWEGVLRYMYKLRDRRAADREIPTKFWGWLLERASKAARDVAEVSPQCHNPPSTEPGPQRDPISSPPELPSNIQTQICLSNPAYHLTVHIYTYYVTSMSLRPSYSTLLNILHLAAQTGTPWLARSVAATMTYMDGIDETGKPHVSLEPDVLALVEQSTVVHEQAMEAAGRDLEREREERRRVEQEKKRIEQEDERWWDMLFESFENEEKEKKLKNTEMPQDSADEVEYAGASVQAANCEKALDSTAASRPGPEEELRDIDRPKMTEKERREDDFVHFDRKSVPPGNLWPLFPSIGKFGSAHVDPWEALGPRSSARRKWTEAQEHYKQVERSKKKTF